VILLDTAGRSPHDAERLERLAETLSSVERLEVLLVCAANHSEAALRDAVARFAPARPTGVVVTKLDETRQGGTAFGLAAAAGLPVAFLCDGQEVPADIERATGEGIARRILRSVAHSLDTNAP
jgi:flagellar biosynthesis protein FlhF